LYTRGARSCADFLALLQQSIQERPPKGGAFRNAPLARGYRLQSSSASRQTAGEWGFFILSLVLSLGKHFSHNRTFRDLHHGDQVELE